MGTRTLLPKEHLWSSSKKMKLLVCAALLLSLGYASALNCYACAYSVSGGTTSSGSMNCTSDNFMASGSDVTETSCTGYCTLTKVYVDDNNYSWARSCASSCTQGSSGNSFVKCCSTDLCNSASPVTISFTSLLLVAVAFMYSRWQ